MEIILSIILVFTIIIVLIAWAAGRQKKHIVHQPIPGNFKNILLKEVEFYEQLDEEKRLLFENRVQQFLSSVKITGVNTTVEDLDRVLIAASAIIPIFAFPNWEYINLNEVLLYPDSFDDKFQQEGAGRNTLGMVGTGAYQNIMILSKHELRQGFLNRTGKTNTAIHEFVHLVDKTDGDTDGIPESIMAKSYIIPWLKLAQSNITSIKENESDINPYGATSQTEFFAVVSEYFFERPDLLQAKHPQLYELLVKIFRQQPPKPGN